MAGVISPVVLSRQQEERTLAEVLGSAAFHRSARMEKLLSYLCAEYFRGHSDVTEYKIGVDALGRRESFDPSTDAIVRVELHRLRRKLREYHEGEGSNSLVQLEIPAGTYIPAFSTVRRAPEETLEKASSSVVSVEVPVAPPAEMALTVVPVSISADRWRKPVLLAAAILVVAASAFVAYISYGRSKATPVFSAFAATTPQRIAAFPGGNAIRILCGSKMPHMDKAGQLWQSDGFYSGGAIGDRPRQFLSRTYDFTLYSHSREGATFSYDIPLEHGVYDLHLYFAETSYGPGTRSGGGEASRLFDVEYNGKILLSGFDILADAPGSGVADERVFKDVVPGQDGKVHLKFTGLRDHAMLDGIALIPSHPYRMNPLRLSTQDVSYTDSSGTVWAPDNYWTGGQKPFHVVPVGGTRNPMLYSTERYGNFSYSIPVAPGVYDVNVHVAETYWGSENAGGLNGERSFDILCNGVALERNINILKRSGPNRALVLHYTGLRPNAQGKLELSFLPVVNYATLCALEVINTGD